MLTRFQHLGLALRLGPGLLVSASQRAQLTAMRVFCRNLPQALHGSLTEALQRLTPSAGVVNANAHQLRDLADLAALLERHSPLGLCLRRSLTRYYFLRRAGVPVQLCFGAKFSHGQPDRNVTGHAWLTLNAAPYFEADENWRGFTVMFTHPAD